MRILLILLCVSSLNIYAQNRDIFEQFALQKRQVVPGLERNPATLLPDVVLRWDAKVQEAFKPGKTISTQKQLNKELERMREMYAPFMAELAPELPEIRKRTELKEFQWKLLASEMGTDQSGSLYPLPELIPVAEPNPWKKVTIPHYTGPINKAEALYRKWLDIDSVQLDSESLYLHFDGVDYRCEVYVNEQKIGSHIGLMGSFEFDIKPYVKLGENLLEVRVFNDSPMMGDNFFLGPDRKFGKKLVASGGPGWDEPGLGKGWTMSPPGFGIWQSCYMETRNDVFINDLYVRSILDESKVEVWVELPDNTSSGQIRYSLYGQNFELCLAENQRADKVSKIPAPGAPGFTTYIFSVSIPKEQLRVWSSDKPWLYQIQIQIDQGGKLVDAVKQQFGMRSFIQSETSNPKGRFYLNGKEIKLRGANMMGNLMQCVIRNDLDQLRDDILLAKIVGMNFWRMTQQPCQQVVYEYFDKLGLLAQSDMPTFNGYRKDALEELKPQFVEFIRMIRNHPSNAVISYLNEPGFNKPMMLDRKGHEELFLSFDAVAEHLNPGQVTKWVDGDYPNLAQKFSDHHVYNTWYGNSMRNEYFGNWPSTREGWMHACGEYGAEGLDNIKLMKKYYPKEWLTTDSMGVWDPRRIPRCQTPDIGGKWLNLSDSTMTEWVKSSREYQKWATRLFTETLRRDPKMNSFAIHLLIDAWPSSWLKSIMDTDREAKPAYYAYRNALRPVTVNLRPDVFYGFSGDSTQVAVFICNDTPKDLVNTKLRYQIELNGKILKSGRAKATVPASNPQFQGWLKIPFPEVEIREYMMVSVALFDEDGAMIHGSSYDLEVFPESDKGMKIEWPGGYPQRLIN